MNKEMPAGREYLIAGMDWIEIPVRVFDKNYSLIATRKKESEYYRAASNALEDLYVRVKSEAVNPVSIEIMEAPSAITQNYCMVAARLRVGNFCSDPQIGEIRVTAASPDTDKEAPYAGAYRKARAKCICFDLLGLPSRFFDENGVPVVYFEDRGGDDEEPDEPLNSVQQKEFDELSNFTFSYRTTENTIAQIALKDCTEEYLKFFSSDINADVSLREKVKRYYDLKKKKERAE